MICNNQIHVRKKDGTQFIITRCADPSCVHFTKEVTEEQCKLCSRHPEAASTPVRKAAETIPQPPGHVRRVITWAQAVAGWVAAGRPERSDEEVQHIFHTFCAGSPACSWYDPHEQMCRGCGCGVSNHKHAILNKIKMATQHCPRNLW